MVFVDSIVTKVDKSQHYWNDTNVEPTSPISPKCQPGMETYAKLKGADDDQVFTGDYDIDDDQSRHSIRSFRSIGSGKEDCAGSAGALSPRRIKPSHGSGSSIIDRKLPRKSNSRRSLNYDIEELMNDDSGRHMFPDRSVCSNGSKRANRIANGSSNISFDFDVEGWVNNNETARVMDRSFCSANGSHHNDNSSTCSKNGRKHMIEGSSRHRRSIDFDLEEWMNENGVPVLHTDDEPLTSSEPLSGEPPDNTSEPLSNNSEPLSNDGDPLSNHGEPLLDSKDIFIPLDSNNEPLRLGPSFDIDTNSLRSSSSHSSNRSGRTNSTWPRLKMLKESSAAGNPTIHLQLMTAFQHVVAEDEKTEETKLHELWSENDLLLVDNFNKDEEEDIRYWKDRLEREEIYGHQYQPTQRERQEVQHVALFLGIQDHVRSSTAAKNQWLASLQRVADQSILARLHAHTKRLRQVSVEARRLGALFHPSMEKPVSIVLKRGPVLFQNEKRELIFLTHGFVVAKLQFLESVNAALEVPNNMETQATKKMSPPHASLIPKLLSKMSPKDTDNSQRKDESVVRNHDACHFWTNVRTMKPVEDDPLSFSIVLNNDDNNNFANNEVQYTFTCPSELQAEAWLIALNHVIVRAYTNSATASMAAYFACCDDAEDFEDGEDEHEMEKGEDGQSSMNSIELEEDEQKEQPPTTSFSPQNKINPFQKAMTAFQQGGLRFQFFLNSTCDPTAIVKQQADESPTEVIQKPQVDLADSNAKKGVNEPEDCDTESAPLHEAASKARHVFQNALTVLQEQSKLVSNVEQPSSRDQNKLVHKLRDKATKQRFLHP